MSISKSSMMILLLALLLVVSNGMWFVRTVDHAVGRTHRASQVTLERGTARLLADLVLASELPLDRPHLEGAVGALPDREDLIVKREGDTLEVDDIGFVFDGDRVTRIQFLWEPAQAAERGH